MLDNWFSNVVCINLDRRTDRWADTQAELALCGIKKYERFSAVDHPTNGTDGCAMSHREVWARIASGALGDRVLILEDDVHLITPRRLRDAGFVEDSDVWRIFSEPHISSEDLARWVTVRFAIMVHDLPTDWEALYLGGSYERKPIARVSKHLIRTAGMHTTHAYALTRSAAQKMTIDLDSRAPRSAHIGGIDSFLCDCTQKMNFYAFSPRLFVQRPSLSDINPNASLGFPWSQTDPTHEMMV